MVLLNSQDEKIIGKWQHIEYLTLSTAITSKSSSSPPNWFSGALNWSPNRLPGALDWSWNGLPRTLDWSPNRPPGALDWSPNLFPGTLDWSTNWLLGALDRSRWGNALLLGWMTWANPLIAKIAKVKQTKPIDIVNLCKQHTEYFSQKSCQFYTGQIQNFLLPSWWVGHVVASSCLLMLSRHEFARRGS